MKRRDEVLVGITATLAMIAGVLGALWLARGGLRPGYPLFARFTWGAGLKQGQPVLLSGVSVGHVDGVYLLPDGILIVRLSVRKNYQVPRGTTATIEPNGFFGDQLVALKPHGPNPKFFVAGDTIESGRPTPSVGDVLSRVDTIASHLSVLMGALRKELVQTGGFTELRTTVRNASALLEELKEVVAHQDAELARTQAALRRVANAVDSAQVDSTIRSLKDAGTNVKTLAADLKETTARLNVTLAKVNEGSGTMAKLMNDSTLYHDVRSLTTRLDSLIADFKKNPRKYIKLSIF
ncbi:MAG TPA: MlaD family protein [Gemmatimonadaceae bacterium]|nr:MlaD family protein [Gemmatimonadaceae bacterium]